MRVALAALFEECNTFAVESLGTAKITGNFATGFQGAFGDEILALNRGVGSALGGFIDALEAAPEVEIVPTAQWQYGSGPTMEGAAYRKMKQEILDRLEAALPLDAIALDLHGAGIAEGVDDVEGDLTSAIRELVGPDVKIVCSLDHHGNITDRHLRQMDFMAGVRNYPHTDQFEVGQRVGRLIPDLVKGTIKPKGHLEHIPFLMQMTSTMDGCLFAPIREKVVEFSKRPGIYDLTYFYGFPFADVPFVGPTVNCWAETSELAAATAKEFAAWVWENRARFLITPVSAAEAVNKALAVLQAQGRVAPAAVADIQVAHEWVQRLPSRDEVKARTYGALGDKDSPGPVVIADKSDNIGNGAPGDGTHLLWELLKANVQQAAISAIRDADTVKRAIAAGVGAIIDVELGGKMSKLSGEPLRAKAYVKSLSDGRYRLQCEMNYAAGIDVGPAAGLLIEGVDMAVVSGGMQAFDHGQLQMVGFDALDYRVIVLKSANHFRGWWAPVASEIIDCDAPGVATNDLTTLTYKNKARALYPLDADAAYPESGWRW